MLMPDIRLDFRLITLDKLIGRLIPRLLLDFENFRLPIPPFDTSFFFGLGLIFLSCECKMEMRRLTGISLFLSANFFRLAKFFFGDLSLGGGAKFSKKTGVGGRFFFGFLGFFGFSSSGCSIEDWGIGVSDSWQSRADGFILLLGEIVVRVIVGFFCSKSSNRFSKSLK